MEVTINPATEPADPGAGSPQAKQLPGRACNPTPQQITGLKLYCARPCPPEQDPVFPTTSPIRKLTQASQPHHQRADRRSKKNHNPTATKTKAHHRKLISMKKQEVVSQMKGQDKTPGKQPNEVETGNLPKKEFRVMIVKRTQDLGNTMEKIQEMFTKGLQEQKNRDE